MCTKELIGYMEAHPIEVLGESSLTEYFGKFYRMYHPIDCSMIREETEMWEWIVKSLSRRKERMLLRAVSNVCDTHESMAFFEGLRVGAQLILELQKSR